MLPALGLCFRQRQGAPALLFALVVGWSWLTTGWVCSFLAAFLGLVWLLGQARRGGALEAAFCMAIVLFCRRGEGVEGGGEVTFGIAACFLIP